MTEQAFTEWLDDGDTPMTDPVNHPDHYNMTPRETFETIRGALPFEGFISYNIATVLKYTCRHPYKGKPIQDLKKAKWHLEAMIDAYEREEKDYE